MTTQALLQPLASCGRCSFTASQRFTRQTYCANNALRRQCKSPYGAPRTSRRVHLARAEDKSRTKVNDHSPVRMLQILYVCPRTRYHQHGVQHCNSNDYPPSAFNSKTSSSQPSWDAVGLPMVRTLISSSGPDKRRGASPLDPL